MVNERQFHRLEPNSLELRQLAELKNGILTVLEPEFPKFMYRFEIINRLEAANIKVYQGMLSKAIIELLENDEIQTKGNKLRLMKW